MLATPALVARVASSMSPEGITGHPPYPVRPGFCCFCNHPLSHGYRITTATNGKIEQETFPLGHAGFEKRAADVDLYGIELSAVSVMVWPDKRPPTTSFVGLKHPREFIPPMLLTSATCCDALTTAVFDAASRVKREKAAAAAKAIAIKASAREMAAKSQSRKLAAILARKEQEKAPPPDPGHF